MKHYSTTLFLMFDEQYKNDINNYLFETVDERIFSKLKPKYAVKKINKILYIWDTFFYKSIDNGGHVEDYIILESILTELRRKYNVIIGYSHTDLNYNMYPNNLNKIQRDLELKNLTTIESTICIKDNMIGNNFEVTDKYLFIGEQQSILKLKDYFFENNLLNFKTSIEQTQDNKFYVLTIDEIDYKLMNDRFTDLTINYLQSLKISYLVPSDWLYEMEDNETFSYIENTYTINESIYYSIINQIKIEFDNTFINIKEDL